MFYDAKLADQLNEKEKRKKRVKLRRDLISKKEVLRREELRLNKLIFDERNVQKEDDKIKADISKKENSATRLLDEMRLLEENINANKKNTHKLNDEIKNSNLKVNEIQRKKDVVTEEMKKIRNEMVRINEEIKKLENEIKIL